METTREFSLDTHPGSNWWIPIGMRAAIVPVMALVAGVLPPDPFSLFLIFPLTFVAGTLSILSPLFVYFDRDSLMTTAEWEPSGVYYLMFLPLIGVVLAVVYLYNRHTSLGVP